MGSNNNARPLKVFSIGLAVITHPQSEGSMAYKTALTSLFGSIFCKILVSGSVPVWWFKLIRLAEEVPSQRQRAREETGGQPVESDKLGPPADISSFQISTCYNGKHSLCSSGPIITESYREEGYREEGKQQRIGGRGGFRI